MCLAVRACGRAEVAWRWEGCRPAACAAANIVVVVFYILLELLWYFGCMRPWPGSVSLTHVVFAVFPDRVSSGSQRPSFDAGRCRSAQVGGRPLDVGGLVGLGLPPGTP